MIACYQNGGKLLVCGNGGSASDSLHIVGELMKGFVLPRKLDENMQKRLREACPEMAEYCIENLQGALPAISLVSEAGLTTAYANDQAPDLAFAQQVLGQAKPGDVLLAISTSGNSANVLYAIGIARALHVKTIGLTGHTGGKMASLCDVCIKVPGVETFKIQEYTCRCTMRFVCVWKKNFSGNECFKASLRSGLKLQFSETNKNSRHRNASHFSVPAVFGRIGYHSAKLWHQARKSAGERPVFRSFPSTRAASGERLFFKAAAVFPNPLPPEVANRMTLFPEKS
ncbi:MAG: SIS domain-containing protein [Ruthenibacterium lactatiformans]